MFERRRLRRLHRRALAALNPEVQPATPKGFTMTNSPETVSLKQSITLELGREAAAALGVFLHAHQCPLLTLKQSAEVSAALRAEIARLVDASTENTQWTDLVEAASAFAIQAAARVVGFRIEAPPTLN